MVFEREHGIRVVLNIGTGADIWLAKSFLLSTHIVAQYDNHPFFTNERGVTERWNAQFSLTAKYIF